MSMRLNLAGFRLSELRKQMGSHDSAVVEALEAKLTREAKKRSAWGIDKPEFAAGFSEALRRAIHEGPPFEGLDREAAFHSVLADWLVHLAGGRPASDGDFKLVPLLELIEAAATTDDSILKLELGYLLEGRPLFGRRGCESPYYGYLSRDEALDLRNRLVSLADMDDCDPDVGEIAADLADALDEIASASRDVWALVA